MDLFSSRRLDALDLKTADCFDCQDVFGSGSFQRRLLLVAVLSTFVMHCHTVAFALISRDVDHWCRQPPGLNVSAADWKRAAIPVEADGRFSRCLVYSNPGDGNDTATVECDSWDYDAESAPTTIMSRWNLVCRHLWLITVANIVYSAGSPLFLIAAGHIADRGGRKPILWVSIAMLLIVTFAGCFADTYSMYITTRFLAAGFAAVNVTVSLVMLFEGSCFCDRVLKTCFAASFPFLLSDMWSQLLRLNSVHLASARVSWVLLQIVLLSPTLLLVVAFAIVQESPRWLIASRDLQKAGAIILYAAEINNFQPLSTNFPINMVRAEDAKNEELRGADTPGGPGGPGSDIPRRALVALATHAVITFAAHVLVLSSAAMSVRHLWWISSGATMLSYALLYTFAARAVAMTQLLSVSLVTLIVLACTMSAILAALSLAPLVAAIFVAAKAVAYFAIVVHTVYVVEVFPTPVRVTALSWVSAWGRVGAIIAHPTSRLQDAGREDLSLAIAAALLFATLMAFLALPPKPPSEKLATRRTSTSRKPCAELGNLAARRLSTSSKPSIEVMKETLQLQPLPTPSRKSSKSRSSSLSSSKSSLAFPSENNKQHRHS
ncbi:solute carrier family 22 member 7 [Rhipicephalus sanguineus]|uniref:Organic cation/carnitine transporter n=1 Tax=Rhipicephalus sanguineus TaxID=34632 RepID=A0A9D4Q6M6_RHISA|nr:solute carrier family 22 member 7 [Rhipicephalus sanguineus]KAH7969005.1 hypothetical protein HPB52_013603 [Rhipicephalus sanguineus]